MEIEASHLLAYFVIWSIFYFLLSQYISSLSRDKWIEYVRSPESDDMLLEALDPIVEEIEIRMDEKLTTFTGKFFGSIGEMTRRAQEMNPATDLKKAMKQGDWGSVLLEYALNKSQLGGIIGQLKGSNPPQTDENETKGPPKMGQL
jgi:hypothetical protein